MDFFEKLQKLPSAGAPNPVPLASEGWGLCPRPPAAGGSAPDPRISSPVTNFWLST